VLGETVDCGSNASKPGVLRLLGRWFGSALLLSYFLLPARMVFFSSALMLFYEPLCRS